MKKILFFILVTLFLAGGCSGLRITNLPDKYVKTKTDRGKRVRTTVTEVEGKVMGKKTTTDEWEKEKVTTRPFRYRDRMGGGYRGYGYR